MKNSMLFLLSLLLAFSVQAQTEKGKFSLSLHNSPTNKNTNGSGISYSSLTSSLNGVPNTESLKRFNIGIAVSAQYFIINNLSLGTNFSHDFGKSHQEGRLSENPYQLYILHYGPEINYFIKISDKTKVKIAQQVNFSYQTHSKTIEKPTSIFSISRAGIAYFPNKDLSLDIGMVYYYQYYKAIFKGTSTRVSKSTNTGMGIDVGFSVYF